MTDKQKEEYKRDYFMRFDHEPVNIEHIWDWIEDLVEEVEREAMKEGWNRAVLTVNDAEQERLKYLKKWLPIKAKEIETN